MERYDPKRLELSTRDVVARAIYTEVKEGRGTPHGGVFLDVSHLPAATVRSKLPSMYDQFMELAGVDITREPMEVGPTCHYFMGGIRVDAETGASTVPGLFATGECSGGMNGANRLGGNSLSDLLVFGKRAGEGAARHAADGARAAARRRAARGGRRRDDALPVGTGRRGSLPTPRRAAGDDAGGCRDLPRRGGADRGGRPARRARAARRRRSFPVEHDRLQPGLAPLPRPAEHADRLARRSRAPRCCDTRAAAPTAGSTSPTTTTTGASTTSSSARMGRACGSSPGRSSRRRNSRRSSRSARRPSGHDIARLQRGAEDQR